MGTLHVEYEGNMQKIKEELKKAKEKRVQKDDQFASP
jgi:hypothetical protein